MGFGLLLIGYIFAFVAAAGLGPYIFAGSLIGGFFMYLGITELRRYSPAFIYSLICSVLIILCSFLGAAIWIDSSFALSLGIAGGIYETFYGWVKFVINLLFNLTLLYGIVDISSRVDFPDTRKKAIRNYAFVIVFNIAQILLLLPIGFIQEDLGFFSTLLLFLQIIYSVVNAWLIFNCYAMICPEGQESIPRKRSRFEFVNRFRDIRDAKEEKAIEEMKNYYEDKLKQRNNKKKKSKNKHK